MTELWIFGAILPVLDVEWAASTLNEDLLTFCLVLLSICAALFVHVEYRLNITRRRLEDLSAVISKLSELERTSSVELVGIARQISNDIELLSSRH
jgi:hypothetical protein